MNFYNDFTYYSEEHFEDAINIGWVLPEKKWDIAHKDKEIIVKELLKYLDYPVNQVRGGNYYKQLRLFEKDYTLGFSEIRVLSGDGKTVFALPNMVIYSIMEQNYYPPKQFLEALFNGLKPGGEEYNDYISKYNEMTLWGKNKEYINLSNNLVKLIEENNDVELSNIIEKDKSILNMVTENGSLLNVAILNNQQEIAHLLIKKGVDINKFSGIELLSAIKTNQDSVIKELINRSICVQTYNQKVNPLFYAVEVANINAIKTLIASDYDLFKTYTNEFVRNCNIADWANKFKNDEVQNILLSTLKNKS